MPAKFLTATGSAKVHFDVLGHTVELKFQATIRYWRPEQNSGLAVADVPLEIVALLGGLKQMKVKGR